MAGEGSRFACVWEELPDGQALSALINGEVGWLMYLPDVFGDHAGFSSRNPEYAGAPDAKIEYYQDNGQRDTYPAAWALPVEVVREALAYFKRERRRPPFVVWHED